MTLQLDTIRGLWIGPELSLMEQICINSFLANGHAFELFVYDEVKNIPKGVIVRNAEEILPALRIFTYKKGFARGGLSGFVNLFRLKLLAEQGGWWCDLDVVCLKPFVFESPIVISGARNNDGTLTLNNGIMKAPAGDPFFVQCYESANAMDPLTLTHAQNGGNLLNSFIDKFDYRKHIVSAETFNPINPKDWKELVEAPFDPTVFKNSFGVHLWSEMWNNAIKDTSWKKYVKRYILRNIPQKNKRYPSTCIYGYFQKKYLN